MVVRRWHFSPSPEHGPMPLGREGGLLHKTPVSPIWNRSTPNEGFDCTPHALSGCLWPHIALLCWCRIWPICYQLRGRPQLGYRSGTSRWVAVLTTPPCKIRKCCRCDEVGCSVCMLNRKCYSPACKYERQHAIVYAKENIGLVTCSRGAVHGLGFANENGCLQHCKMCFTAGRHFVQHSNPGTLKPFHICQTNNIALFKQSTSTPAILLSAPPCTNPDTLSLG